VVNKLPAGWSGMRHTRPNVAHDAQDSIEEVFEGAILDVPHEAGRHFLADLYVHVAEQQLHVIGPPSEVERLEALVGDGQDLGGVAHRGLGRLAMKMVAQGGEPAAPIGEDGGDVVVLHFCGSCWQAGIRFFCSVKRSALAKSCWDERFYQLTI
jgi:hypothetical protein